RVPHTYSFPTTRLPPRSTLFPYTTLFRSLAMYARVNFPKFAKVLESYVKNRGKEAVIAAAFTFLSYGYFLEDIRIDMFVFKGLESFYEDGSDLDLICWLALLKRYRFCKKLNTYQKENVKGILNLCRRENLRFAFFKELPQELTRGMQLEDKIFVEKRFAPDRSEERRVGTE